PAARGLFPSKPTSMPSSAESLALVRESILALQKMQQHSTEAHRQFLEGHITSQKLFFELIARQLGDAPGATSNHLPTDVARETVTPAVIPATTFDALLLPAFAAPPPPAFAAPPPLAFDANSAAPAASSAAASVPRT